ncbi:hypothetical protein ACOSQ4_024335 [Xanthoceras sorbifolium]
MRQQPASAGRAAAAAGIRAAARHTRPPAFERKRARSLVRVTAALGAVQLFFFFFSFLLRIICFFDCS